MEGKEETQKRKSLLRLFKNFGFMTMGKTLGDVFTFFLFVIFSRYFGEEGLGQYSFAMALSGFLVVFSDFGLYHLSVREMSRNLNTIGECFSKIFFVRLVLTGSVLLCVLVITPFLPLAHDTKIIFVLISVYQILYVLMDGIMSVFVAREEMHLVGVMECSFRIFCALTGIAFVLAGSGLIMAVSAFPIVSLIHIGVAYSMVHRKYEHFCFSRGVSYRFVVDKLRDAVPYCVSMLLIQISTRVDVLFLGFYLGMGASGIYNAAYRIIFLLMYFPTFLGITIFPMSSRLYVESRGQLKVLYQQALSLIVLVGLPAAAGLCLVASDLIDLIYGENFSESITILRCLSILVFLAGIKSITGILLTSCNRQTEMTKAQWKGACLNVIGNIFLIPTVGILGAAIATVISETLVVGLFLKQLQPVLGFPEVISRLMISSLATATFIIPLLYVPSPGLWVMIPSAIGIYAATLSMFKEIRNNEFRLLLGFLRGSSV